MSLISIYLLVGLVEAAVLFFGCGILKIPVFISAPIILVFLVWQGHKLKFSFDWSIPISVVLALLISSSLFGQFFYGNGGLAVNAINAHDAWWHIALEQSLKKSVPPINPLFFPQVLTGYHYLTDILLANISLLSHISLEDLYFKWSPLFLAWLYVGTSLALFRRVVSQNLAYLGVLVLLFGGSLAFFVPVLISGVGFNQSFFWLDQAGRYVVNQQLLFSLSAVNAIFYFLLEKNSRNWWLVGFLLGSLVGIKVYAAIVVWPFVLAWLVWHWWVEKDFRWLLAGVFAAVISLALFLVSGQGTGFPFIFEPGWLVQSMIAGADRFNFSTWEIHRQLFSQTHNYFRLALIWTGALGVFLVGNFGLKVLALFLVPFLGLGSRSPKKILLFSSLGIIILSLILPLLFLQKGVVWNVVQFMHYAQMPLVLILLMAVSAKKFGSLAKSVLLISLATGVFTSARVVISDLQPENYVIYPTQTLAQLQALPDDGLVIVGSDLTNSSLVPAVSGRPVYYADPVIISILRIDAKPRMVFLRALESGSEPCLPGSSFITGREQGNIQVSKCAGGTRLLE